MTDFKAKWVILGVVLMALSVGMSYLSPGMVGEGALSGVIVTVIVRDGQGNGLIGVTVRLTGGPSGEAHQGSTNGLGYLYLQNVDPGSGYMVTASKTGYQTFTRSGITIQGSVPQINIMLATSGGQGSIDNWIHGTVSVGYVDVGPMANVVVTLSGAKSASALTDALGYYRFRQVPDGDYTVTARTPGGDSMSKTTAVSGSTVRLDFEIRLSLFKTDFLVQDLTVTHITGALITMDTGATATTGPTGEASFNLPAGNFGYTVTAEGFKPVTGTTPAGGPRVEVQMTPATTPDYEGTLKGVVVVTTEDGTTAPVAGASILIPTGSGVVNVYTDDAGYFEVNLFKGSYSFMVRASGMEDLSSGVVIVEAGKTTDCGILTMTSTGGTDPEPEDAGPSLVWVVVGALMLALGLALVVLGFGLPRPVMVAISAVGAVVYVAVFYLGVL